MKKLITIWLLCMSIVAYGQLDTLDVGTPATAGAGWQCTINDSDGSGLLYKIESDGTSWFYLVMTAAL